MILNIVAAVLIGFGTLCCVISIIGIYRFDYVLTRIHAAAIVDTLGTLCIFLGIILLKGFGWGSIKILLILAFQWITGPVLAIEYLLLIGLIVCAIAVNVTKHLLPTVIISVTFGTMLSVVWLLLKAPDLAITEAAVGVGIETILYLMTIRKVHHFEGIGDETE